MDKGELGRKLRRLRKERGLKGKDIAAAVGCSQAAVSKYEHGLLRPTLEYIERFIRAVGLGREEAEALRDYCAYFEIRFRGWSLDPESLQRTQERIGRRERRAKSIRSFQIILIPGLLQTKGYMAAVFKALSSATASDLTKAMDLRLGRQSMLNKKGSRFTFVIYENVLRTVFGNNRTHIGQLRHLRAYANSRENIELRIIQQSMLWEVVPVTSFVIFDERSVNIELFDGEVDIWEDARVANYIELMDKLVSASAPRERTLAILDGLIKYYSKPRVGKSG